SIGCTQSTDGADDKKIVAVSIIPQESFVKEVAGELVEVITLIPPGSSPETYSPTPKELQKFSQASIYFTIGVPAEEANILPAAKDLSPDTKIVDLASIVSQEYPDREFAPGERDPHIWLSPKRVKVMIDVIQKELSALDPENSDTYRKNAEDYKARLDELDANIKEMLKDLQNKSFIVYHPAFGYFADDYGLEMISLEEEGKEATPQRFQELVEIAKSKGIKVIFHQAEVDSRQAKAFAEEIGGRTEKIEPLSPNYIENLEKMAKTIADALKAIN
ncbi:MAG: zinc ABC transporter substrate-binding protein, partial [Tissierellales bacterium]